MLDFCPITCKKWHNDFTTATLRYSVTKHMTHNCKVLLSVGINLYVQIFKAIEIIHIWIIYRIPCYGFCGAKKGHNRLIQQWHTKPLYTISVQEVLVEYYLIIWETWDIPIIYHHGVRFSTNFSFKVRINYKTYYRLLVI